ncbi:MAG: malate dehydrogenase, partial [Bacilli bacterium]|nr:malate dehydrogenase [Bacilli bacterium]
ALFDAANGWGQPVSVKAMNTAIDKALQCGTAFVGVRNSNHFGTASYYTKMAASRGCIGIAMTNASAVMVPFGAMEASLGTNPISIAVPTSNPNRPVMLDMATSNVARGKIILANKNGTSIPDDWAITIDGEPTTDPVKALEGFVLPFGGAKGSGLAIIVDILTGVLTGSLFGKDVPRMYEDNAPQQIGHFFGAINIEAFMDKAEFLDRMQERIKQTVESKPVKGFSRVYMPGEIELSRKEKQEKEGVSISVEVFQELTKTGAKYGVEMEDFIPKED